MSVPYAEVIGDPVAHSKSPLIHRFWLARTGIEGDYRATHVTHSGLAGYFEARSRDPDWRGCNVTVPHKQAVTAFLAEQTPLARQVGAVNVVVPRDGLCGGNSDVRGIQDAVPSFEPGELRQACLIGSGGAALAAMAAFRLLGVERVGINVRNQAKGEELVRRFGFEGRAGPVDDQENIFAAQLIVNASTLGMNGQPAMPDTLLRQIRAHPNDRAVLFDMVYAPLETELLAAGRDRGLRLSDGLAMLVGQAASAFDEFFGLPAPREHDAELRALLTA